MSIKLEYNIRDHRLGEQHIGPLKFNFPKILKEWVKVITQRGAYNIRINDNGEGDSLSKDGN